MTTKYERLKNLLLELFQLDKPDLDFGIYRIMHARSAEISGFLDNDLLPQVRQALAVYDQGNRAQLEAELAEAIAQAVALGADPEALPKIIGLRGQLADASKADAIEGEVYDLIYRFFSRYYSEGDFISQRRYTSESSYAIPYNGEEVTLHWANKDQYYIKTSEYLRDYAFRLNVHDDANPMRVHFKLVDATEGEHGNVKAAEGTARVFVLADAGESGHDFMAVKAGELTISFEYRPATNADWPADQRVGQAKPPKQKDLAAFAEVAVLACRDAELAPWVRALATPRSGSPKSMIASHVERYVARNTFDYFIHKDLGTFLRRELDFFIKNEVMRLDDIEDESAAKVEQYLSKIKAVRKVAGKIIHFLAQLEDFQKKLWLKKKFVVGTSYLITVGNIDERFYPEICANEALREEWVQLFAIDTIEGDLVTTAYSAPLVPDFLKSHPTLVVDTAFLDSALASQLLESIDDLDDSSDGVLVHGDSFQALALLKTQLKDHVDCIFNDPPYNTGGDEFIYRDSFQHSSWLAMMDGISRLCWSLLSNGGLLWVTLDDSEAERFWLAACEWLGGASAFPRIAWQHSIQGKGYDGSLSVHHNSLLCFARTPSARLGLLEREDRHNKAYGNPDGDPKGDWRTGDVRNSLFRPNLRYSIPTPRGAKIEPPENGWRWSWTTMQAKMATGEVFFSENQERIIRKIYLSEQEGRVPESIWFGDEVGTTRSANAELKGLFGDAPFGTPKPSGLIARVANLSGGRSVCDFFAGSGTTGHAIISMNRADGTKRRFHLTEMGEHFDSVLLPRMKKATFAPEWKDGLPARTCTAIEAKRSPQVIKVLRLESYEDTLNNLDLGRAEAQQSLLDSSAADALREDYTLRYMLDVETRGSQSLLSIEAFTDPAGYELTVKAPGSDENRRVNVDLLETFNYLIGLTVIQITAPRTFGALFRRDEEQRLHVDTLKQVGDGGYWFRTVTGTDPDGQRVLVIWRKRPGGEEPEGIEQDNAVLDNWFTNKQQYSVRDSEFDVIYVNGDNNLENLRRSDETWKVRLIEEDFHRLMFDTAGMP